MNSNKNSSDFDPRTWVIKQLLAGRDLLPAQDQATAYAPANIALCKYWGKRDPLFNLPITGSLSVSLADKGTTTSLSVIDSGVHKISLNGEVLAINSDFSIKVSNWLGLFLPAEIHLQINTHNSIPTAAGLASSASGFAALALACNDLFAWRLEKPQLSALARIGSGSACRSLWHGFVKWQAGQQADGSDSIAHRLPQQWADLRVGVLMVDSNGKKVSSREGMERTITTSKLYQQWQAQVAKDLPTIEKAIEEGDFQMLAQTSEQNALSMHATMIAAWPPLLYWQPESVQAMHKIWQLRSDGVAVYFTMDAGPNLKLLYEAKQHEAVAAAFSNIEVIQPFAS